jgi:hypothetical protein
MQMPAPISIPSDITSMWTFLNSAGIIGIVFLAGKVTNRVENLESRERERTTQATEIAVVRTQVGAALDDLRSVKTDVHELRKDWEEFRGTVLNKKLAERS